MEKRREDAGASPGTRIARLAEAVQIIKPLLAGQEVTFTGEHYSVKQVRIMADGAGGAPPLFMGGSGQKMLTLAGRYADIVGFAPRTRAPRVEDHINQAIDIHDALPAALERKLAWVRAGAGERFADLELDLLILEVVVTADRQCVAEQLAARYGLSGAQVLSTPHFLIGDHQQISAQIQAARARYGISYFVIWDEYLEPMAPIVAQLAGK